MSAKYFMVKSGFGTRTSGGGHTTQPTGAFSSLTASECYDNIYDAVNDSTVPPVDGDFIYVSDSHSKTYGASTEVVFPANVIVRSVSDTACDSYSAGAKEIGGTSNYLQYHGASGVMINIRGVDWNSNAGSPANNQIGASYGGTMIVGDCTLAHTNAAATGAAISLYGTQGSKLVLKDVIIDRSATGQDIIIDYADVYWYGGALGSSVAASYAVQLGSGARPSIAELIGIDFSSGLSSSGDIVNIQANSYSGTYVKIVDCKLPASFSGNLVNGTLYGDQNRIEMINCDDGNTNYKLWVETGAGTIREETTDYLTGGASDGTTNISHKMTTNAAADPAGNALISMPLVVLVETTGSTTFTIELLTDGQLTDRDVAIDVMYLGNASYPLGSVDESTSDFVSAANNLAAGVGTGSWNSTSGLTTPTSSKLTSTVTVNQKGFALVFVKVYKPSITLYMDPKVTVS